MQKVCNKYYIIYKHILTHFFFTCVCDVCAHWCAMCVPSGVRSGAQWCAHWCAMCVPSGVRCVCQVVCAVVRSGVRCGVKGFISPVRSQIMSHFLNTIDKQRCIIDVIVFFLLL